MRGAITTAVATDSYDSFLFQTVPITKSQRKKRNEMNNSSTYLCTNYRNEKKEKNNEIKLFLHTHAHTHEKRKCIIIWTDPIKENAFEIIIPDKRERERDKLIITFILFIVFIGIDRSFR